MRLSCAVVLTILLMTASADAQEEFRKPKKTGFAFFAPGVIAVNVKPWNVPSYEIGGGFEGYLHKGFGLGVDAGSLYIDDPYALKRWTYLLCVYGTYDFQRTAAQKLSPFLVAGVSLAPQFDVGGGYHFGGGVKYWFGEHLGLRLEFRDHGRVGALHIYHDVQGRIGIMFR